MGHIRQPSESGIHHVMTHTTEGSFLFHDNRDRGRYLVLLKRYMEQYDVEMLAWCLMGNHVHLLPRVPSNEELSLMMRDTSCSYAKYYNLKYGRDGHLHHRRFHSKPVETDPYLLTVVRYIHQNPIWPHLSATCDYRWSSYREYVGADSCGITSTELVLDIIDGVESFVAFHSHMKDSDGSLDPVKLLSPTDDEALTIAQNLLSTEQISSSKNGPKEIRDKAVQKLREEGLLIRQIASILEVPYSTVGRIVSENRLSS